MLFSFILYFYWLDIFIGCLLIKFKIEAFLLLSSSFTLSSIKGKLLIFNYYYYKFLVNFLLGDLYLYLNIYILL